MSFTSHCLVFVKKKKKKKEYNFNCRSLSVISSMKLPKDVTLLFHWLVFYFQTNALDNRKKKAVHKTTTTDDKRLQSTLKRIGVNAIPAIEEVNIFKDDVVIQFNNPKGKFYLSIYCTSILLLHILG